jgi:hypothetical protein
MIRRGRFAALALILLGFFIYLTSRNSGSHPRDLKPQLQEEAAKPAIVPFIKEPPGTWDPVADKFKDDPREQSKQEGPRNKNPDTRVKPAPQLGSEIGMRKTPKKGKNKDENPPSDSKEQYEAQRKSDKQGAGIENEATHPLDQKVIANDGYDPAEGISDAFDKQLTLDLRSILTQAPLIVPTLIINLSYLRYFQKHIVAIRGTPNEFY